LSGIVLESKKGGFLKCHAYIVKIKEFVLPICRLSRHNKKQVFLSFLKLPKAWPKIALCSIRRIDMKLSNGWNVDYGEQLAIRLAAD
jgi:hypothetical protein